MSREIDAKVAEKVMGWTPLHDHPSEAWRTAENELRTSDSTSYRRFSPSRDCNSDYEVLKHVREKWHGDMQDKFADAYEDVMIAKNPAWHCMAYEPGDWSKAALKALGEEV